MTEWKEKFDIETIEQCPKSIADYVVKLEKIIEKQEMQRKQNLAVAEREQ